MSDCPFFEQGHCRLVARMTGLPVDRCDIRPDACAACQQTPTPRTGDYNHVTASIARQLAKRYRFPRAVQRLIQQHTQVVGVSEPELIALHEELAATPEDRRSPSLLQKAKNLNRSAQRWIRAGRPVRDPDEVQRIFAECCRPCRNYVASSDPNRGSCRLCGCRVNLGRGLNKLRWATETCPDTPPKFYATVDDQGQPITKEVQEQMSLEHATNSRAMRMMKRAERKARRTADPQVKAHLLAEAERHRQKMAERGQLPDPDAEPLGPDGRDEAAVRRAERAERKRQRRKRYAPPLHVFPENTDPLFCTDRNKQPIGHILRDLWRPNAGFLVCGGPSLQTIDLGFLRERGIMSLGVNNVSGYAPVRAMTFSDPPEKFHHGVFFDPAIMKLVPIPKLTKRVRAKKPDGTFGFTSLRVCDCPNVWGYRRNSIFDAATFLTNEEATWGNGKKGMDENGRERILFTFFLGLRLLHYLGCRQVFMIGVDFAMRASDGPGSSGYAFNEQRHEGAARSNNESYRKANAMCHELRPIFDAAGFEVYNCNPDSRLTAFDYVPLERAKQVARGLVPPEPWPDDALWGWYAKEDDPKGEDDRGD